MMDDDEREAMRALFATTAQPPRDVVPTAGLTREDLERQSANYMQPVEGTIPGEVITDPDGVPIGVIESRTVHAIFAGTAITTTEARRLGIAPGELPGVHIINTKENDQHG